MCQVLFRVPILDLPVFGFGLMLFAAYFATTWLAARLGKKDGLTRDNIDSFALYLFLFGIAGARVVYMIQYQVPLRDWYRIWEGGLVFYGSLIGGTIGFLVAYWRSVRKIHIPFWRLADIVAPCIAIGLLLGRIGCLLNGCCYGNVACMSCPGISFPMCSAPRFTLTESGLQTAAGFTITEGRDAVVDAVEPYAPAARAGLEPGDRIIEVNGRPIQNYDDLRMVFLNEWPRGETAVRMTVHREDGDVALGAFVPRTLRLHPTQIYESISMLLLFIVLLAYDPFKKRDGDLFVIFLACYAVHRFLNETIRNDTAPVGFGLTLSQNLSIVILIVAAALAFFRARQPVQYPRPQAA